MKKAAVLGLAVLSLAGLAAAPAAQADVTACYSITVVVNGQTVVAESGCQTVDTP